MIAIIDYGMGNVGSVANMLRKIGHKSVLTRDENTILKASAIIIPGVGAYDAGMKNLRDYNLVAPLNKAALDLRVPVLGICLGMQLLTQGSEEGEPCNGLGWIPTRVGKFDVLGQTDSFGKKLAVPHIGWKTLNQRKPSAILNHLHEDDRFYFVHSYCAPADTPYTVATATYGRDFSAILERENILGVQFHPEKSHRYGMQLLKDFTGQLK